MAGAGKRLLEKSTAYCKYKSAETNIRGKDRRGSMYIVTSEGAFAGYADRVIPIKLHLNGCYVPCGENEAEGF